MSLLLQFALIALVPVLVPGPAVLLTAANSLTYGFQGGLLSLVGNGTAIAVAGLSIGLGLGLLASSLPKLVGLLQLVSGSYLFWLGWSFVRSRHVQPVTTGALGSTTRMGIVRQSFILGITNPTGLVFFSSVMPLFFVSGLPLGSQVLSAVSVYLLVVVSFHLTVALCCGRLKHFLGTGNALARLRGAAGALFMVLSLIVIWKGMHAAVTG
jgi:threonine/homoserine/homoserine lactone efflux protein